MRLDPDTITAKKAPQFFEYFHAALRQHRPSSFTSIARFTTEGTYKSAFPGILSLEDSEIQITWRITQDHEGAVLAIEVDADSTNQESIGLENAARTFLQNVLASAFQEEQSSFFVRSYFSYIGAELDGEYWLPGFRFAPLLFDSESPHLHLINAERIIVIDQDIQAVDESHAKIIADRRARRHAAHLSLLLDVGISKHHGEHRWVVFTDSSRSELQSKRQQLGFIDFDSQASMPKKGTLCKLGCFKGDTVDLGRGAGGPLVCPAETRRVLRGLANKPPWVQEAFDRCARLYQVALVAGRYFPSVHMAYLVGAVDAIANTLPKEEYNRSFAKFIRNNIPGTDENIINFLHKDIRSSHWHSGTFLLGEEGKCHPEIMSDPISQLLNSRALAGRTVIREAITAWILRDIAAESTSSQE